MAKPPKTLTAAERADALVKSQQLLKWARGSFIVLLVWLAETSLYLAPAGLSPLTYAVAITFFTLPLLVFTPWLWKGHARAWVWLGYVLLFYIVHASIELFAPGTRGLLAWGNLALVISTFVLGARYVKFKRASADGAL